MGKTATLNLRVSPEFKRRLAEEARKVNRSVTNYIEAALSEFWDLKGVESAVGKIAKKRKLQ